MSYSNVSSHVREGKRVSGYHRSNRKKSKIVRVSKTPVKMWPRFDGNGEYRGMSTHPPRSR